MEASSLSCIESLVSEIKKNVFSTQSFDELVAASAYDTAWLAMVADPSNPDRPLFQTCLNWVLENQKEEGFWGDDEFNGEDGRLPTVDTLPATLACLVALNKWNAGQENISKGVAFFHANVDMLLTKNASSLPHWFTIVFPAMLELALQTGLQLTFLNQPNTLISNLFIKRNQILLRETLVDERGHCCPIFAYLECFPNTIIEDQQHQIYEHVSQGDGSIFRSPAAAAHLFMATANTKSLKYLNSLVQKYPNGVPAKYPVDEELIKLSMFDHIQRLGLAEHFSHDIEQNLSQIYRAEQESEYSPTDMNNLAEKLFKDSLAFRLFRMQGYDMNPGKFCWFLKDEDVLLHLEENHEYFTSVLYNIYRATDLMFPEEYELEEARSFSTNLLQKSLAAVKDSDDTSMFPQLLNIVERELNIPWIARLDHLENRLWIENKFNPLWVGKTSYYGLSHIQNKKLLKLAVQNYEFRQSAYRNELEELKRWSKEKELVDIGFGREKTMYLYFAVASTTCLPQHSFIRLIVAKSAIVITVADDFYDMEGSLTDLQLLTDAVQRWDGDNLTGPSKIIFNALDEVVSEIAARYYVQHRIKIMSKLKHLWSETFGSWMRESRWSQTGYKPSMEQYLETAMVSIAADTVLIPAACFLTPGFPTEKFDPALYEDSTKLLMTTARLLNDIQSYQKEKEQGKMNYVLLHLNEHPEGEMEDSIGYVQDMVDKNRKQFLLLVLMEDGDGMPKSCKLFHLSCLKVFQMFFNSYNVFDSKADLIQEIMKAIYIPFQQDQPSQLDIKPLPQLPLEKSERAKVTASLGPITATRKFTVCHRKLRPDKAAVGFITKQVANNCSFGRTKFKSSFTYVYL